MHRNIRPKYTASAPLRPSLSASHGSGRQPRIVPVDSSIVAYDAIFAPFAPASTRTDDGTYTEPAHSPTIEMNSSAVLTTVRRRYSGENRAANESRALQRR